MEILVQTFLCLQIKFISLEDLFYLHAALEYSSFQDTIFENLIVNVKYWNWDLQFGQRPNFNQIGWIVKNNLNISGISFSGIKIESIINLHLPNILCRGNGNHLLKLTLSNCKFENNNKCDSTDFNQHLKKILNYVKNLRYIDLSSTELNDKGLASISFHCKNVQVLIMQKCFHITNIGIRCVLNHLKRLSELDISFCEKITNGSFEHDEVNMDFLN